MNIYFVYGANKLNSNFYFQLTNFKKDEINMFLLNLFDHQLTKQKCMEYIHSTYIKSIIKKYHIFDYSLISNLGLLIDLLLLPPADALSPNFSNAVA